MAEGLVRSTLPAVWSPSPLDEQTVFSARDRATEALVTLLGLVKEEGDQRGEELVRIVTRGVVLPSEACTALVVRIVRVLLMCKSANCNTNSAEDQRRAVLDALCSSTTTAEPSSALLGECVRSLQGSEILADLIVECVSSSATAEALSWGMVRSALGVATGSSQQLWVTRLLDRLGQHVIASVLVSEDALAFVRASAVARWLYVHEQSPIMPAHYEAHFLKLLNDITGMPSAARSSRQQFLLSQLTAVLPWERAPFLKIHISLFSRLARWRSIAAAYSGLARTRVAELVNENLRLTANPQVPTAVDVTSVVESFRKNPGRIPTVLIEASAFRNSWFKSQFLPLLLRPAVAENQEAPRKALVAELQRLGYVDGTMVAKASAAAAAAAAVPVQTDTWRRPNTFPTAISALTQLRDDHVAVKLHELCGATQALVHFGGQAGPEFQNIVAIEGLGSDTPIFLWQLVLADEIVQLFLRACIQCDAASISSVRNATESIAVLVDAVLVQHQLELSHAVFLRLYLLLCDKQCDDGGTQLALAIVLAALWLRRRELPSCLECYGADRWMVVATSSQQQCRLSLLDVPAVSTHTSFLSRSIVRMLFEL